jgi:hypothetical protein
MQQPPSGFSTTDGGCCIFTIHHWPFTIHHWPFTIHLLTIADKAKPTLLLS